MPIRRSDLDDIDQAKSRIAYLRLVDEDDAYIFEIKHCEDFLALLMSGDYHLDKEKTYIRVMKNIEQWRVW